MATEQIRRVLAELDETIQARAHTQMRIRDDEYDYAAWLVRDRGFAFLSRESGWRHRCTTVDAIEAVMRGEDHPAAKREPAERWRR